MPVTKSAKKAQRQAAKKKGFNDQIRKQLRLAIKNLRLNPSRVTLGKVYSLLDRAVKKSIIHKNKASRLKANYSRMLSNAQGSVTSKKPKK